MFMTSKSHERVKAALKAENQGLLNRIERLEIQLKNAEQLAELRGRAVAALEAYTERQSVNITSLFNENRKLHGQLPARDAKGRFCSKRVKLELVA